MESLLTVAGFDPTAGAGILRDSLVFRRFGFYPTAVITANTVQNTKGVKKVEFVDGDFLISQLSAVLEELPPKAVKLGLPHNDRLVNFRILKKLAPLSVPVVFDTVLAPTYGETFVKSLKAIEPLLELATVLTPNFEEFKVLLKRYRELLKKKAVVIKGVPKGKDSVSDLLVVEGNEVSEVVHRRDSLQIRGTGCTFSSVLTAYLAKGEPLSGAFYKTSLYLAKERPLSFSCKGCKQRLFSI